MIDLDSYINRLNSWAKFYWIHLLNLCFPNFCLKCLQYTIEEQLLCKDCAVNHIIPASLWLEDLTVHALFSYQQPYSQIVTSKFQHNRNLLLLAAQSLYQYSQWLQTMIEQHGIANLRLVPIPMHWWKQRCRGFNQSELLADELSKISGIHIAKLLTKTIATPAQSSLNRNQRQTNLKMAFSATENTTTGGYQNIHLILIDDLCTTGATLIAASKVLKAYRPVKISALVVCRAF